MIELGWHFSTTVISSVWFALLVTIDDDNIWPQRKKKLNMDTHRNLLENVVQVNMMGDPALEPEALTQ